MTMFAHAPKTHLNHSNNPTYIKYGQQLWNDVSGTYAVTEKKEIMIENTVSSSFANYSASFDKQTFISSIGLLDEHRRLIGVAKLANPVRKAEELDYTFKLKLDL